MEPAQSELDFEQAKQIIEEIQQLNMEVETTSSIKTYIQKLMDGYRVYGMNFNPGLVLFRGILYEKKPDLLTDLIYPPLQKVKINRANSSSQQMFYATTSRKAVFYELNVKVGDKIIISTWITNNNLTFNNVGYTSSNLNSLGTNRTTEFMKNREVDLSVANEYVANYLAKTFCQFIGKDNSNLYKLTNAIAAVHLADYHSGKFSGFHYPTVKLNGIEDNFAIIKSTIDHGLLDFERVDYVEIIEQLDDFYVYKILDTADHIEHGRIKWKNLGDQWVCKDSEELFFVEENVRFIAYDIEGNEVSPSKHVP